MFRAAEDRSTSTETADCMLYLHGDCPHGISWKVNGVCSGVHKKRCNKYMKWGSKDEKSVTGGTVKSPSSSLP